MRESGHAIDQMDRLHLAGLDALRCHPATRAAGDHRRNCRAPRDISQPSDENSDDAVCPGVDRVDPWPGGGIRLLKPADQITVGDVVRQTETDFHMVECFDEDSNTCHLNRFCRLKSVLSEATDSYLKVLDGVTVADLVNSPTRIVGQPLRRMTVKV